MTSDAAARRLLAGLVDEQALETEPIAEVRADLAALGLDSTRAVAFARRLAAGAATPAATLLGRIDEAEESDDEIRRLEQADIAALRRDLAEGTTAAAIANAQRAAGQSAKVVGLRRRRPRRLIYGLGGVAAALAASVVFYVGLSTTQYYDDTRDKVSASGTASQTAPTGKGEVGYLRAPATPAEEPIAGDPYKSADAETVSGGQSGPQSQQLTGGNLQSLNQASAPAAPPASVLADEAGAEAKAEADAAEERRRADQTNALNQLQAEVTAQQAARGDGAPSPVTEPAASAAPLPTVPLDDASAAAKSKTEADAAQERRRAAELEGLNQFRVDRDQAELKMTRDELVAALKQRGNAGSSSALSKQQAPAQQQPAGSETTAVATAEPKKQEAAKSNQQTQTLSAAAPTRATSAKPPPFGLTEPVVALLIVDPKLVPADVRQKDYPKGDLPARLADARRLAGDRQIAALVKLRLADRVADAVIVAGAKRGLSVQNSTDFVESAAPVVMPSLDEPYDLIPLERR